jgi:hypothetical protein
VGVRDEVQEGYKEGNWWWWWWDERVYMDIYCKGVELPGQMPREMVRRAALMGKSVQMFLEAKTRHLKRYRHYYCGPTEIQDGTHDVDKFIVLIVVFAVDENIDTLVN